MAPNLSKYSSGTKPSILSCKRRSASSTVYCADDITKGHRVGRLQSSARPRERFKVTSNGTSRRALELNASKHPRQSHVLQFERVDRARCKRGDELVILQHRKHTLQVTRRSS